MSEPDVLTDKTNGTASRRFFREWEFAALGLLVLGVYFTRLTSLAVCGEESRWANAAREMIATGDWVLPRQQGALFAERPPLGSWAMALVGLVRGEVDLVAVRLPSVLAILLLTWLIHAYVRSWATRFAALAAASAFATSAQVMQLGRLGESEALFTLFVGGSLLVWHAGYLQGRSKALVWSAGYGLAALGALTKGLQAPVYFVAATGVFLLLRRDWRWMISGGHALGLAVFVGIVGAWLVPFAQDAWHALDDVWTGLAQDRFSLNGLLVHVAEYPFETMGCMLPWSLLLLALVTPNVRRSIARGRPQVLFVAVALAVTYPTVWFAAGARGRYFMPLYPCLAVVIGLIAERCAAAGAPRAEVAHWRRFVRGLAAAALLGGGLLAIVNWAPSLTWDEARQPTVFLVAWLVLTTLGAGGMFIAAQRHGGWHAPVAVLSIAALVGLAFAGATLNVRIRGGNDLSPAIAEIKQQLPVEGELVSLGRVYHRFAYSYDSPIPQVSWPMTADDLPEDVTYFCFDHRPGDTLEDRAGNDDRLGAHTPGVLPFAWEKIAEVPCDPVKRDEAHRSVVIGRVRRAERMADDAASRPALR
jgi:4-amino-4-deoxy-L-arabinose transferase-like glycosyltransferase